MKFVSRTISGTNAFAAVARMCTAVPALVLSVAMSPAALAQAAVAPKATASAPAKEVETLCAASEAIVFNCRVGDKIVSICASKNAGAAAAAATDASLQYRVGLPNADEVPELKVPVADDKMPTTISGESGSIPGGTGSWLRFRREPYSYTVYTATGKWGAKGEITEKQGVVVGRRGANISSAACTGKLQSQLSAEWFTRNSVAAKSEKFTFPE